MAPARTARAELKLIGLTDQVGSEAVMRLFGNQLESMLEIDVSGGRQRVVGPEPHPLVAGGVSELDRGAGQASPEAAAARLRIDEQNPQLRDARIFVCDAEHAPRALTGDLGDPGGVARVIDLGGEVGHDPRDEPLEALIPSEFGGVALAMGLYDPAEIPGLAERPDRDPTGFIFCLNGSVPN
jgi:hypothetical protein